MEQIKSEEIMEQSQSKMQKNLADPRLYQSRQMSGENYGRYTIRVIVIYVGISLSRVHFIFDEKNTLLIWPY